VAKAAISAIRKRTVHEQIRSGKMELAPATSFPFRDHRDLDVVVSKDQKVSTICILT